MEIDDWPDSEVAAIEANCAARKAAKKRERQEKRFPHRVIAMSIFLAKGRCDEAAVEEVLRAERLVDGIE